uniref:Hypothetical chloroplast RF20 n=1 Tax=Geminella minor TaxID=163309 RepID=A0A097KQ33_GEMMI|nr:hypothetical chloroplast RF20 [Geminella minor]AIT95298.1 hypothetical chloroplast RF20 [Geminella minor]
MNKKIRIFEIVTNIMNFLFLKFLNIEKNLSLNLLYIFFGFLLGNLFGNFLVIFRQIIKLDIVLILIILFLMEFLNSIIYLKKSRKFLFFLNTFQNLKKINVLLNLNFLKLGILLGFFIDAFKVGS